MVPTDVLAEVLHDPHGVCPELFCTVFGIWVVMWAAQGKHVANTT